MFIHEITFKALSSTLRVLLSIKTPPGNVQRQKHQPDDCSLTCAVTQRLRYLAWVGYKVLFLGPDTASCYQICLR